VRSARWEVIHGDCLDVMRAMPDASVDAIVTDPPYFRVKDDAWDRQWASADEFIGWLGTVADEWRRVLRPNGSLYCFTSPEMNTRVEMMLRSRFNVLNNIRWTKRTGWHRRAEKRALRSFQSPWEGIVFAEHVDSDKVAESKCAEESAASGAQVSIVGSKHRRPFFLHDYAECTDVWAFETVPPTEGKHPCEKPVPLLTHIIEASTNPGAVVLDTFCGSGATGVACQETGRHAILIEREAEYVAIARARIEAAARAPMLDFTEAK